MVEEIFPSSTLNLWSPTFRSLWTEPCMCLLNTFRLLNFYVNVTDSSFRGDNYNDQFLGV